MGNLLQLHTHTCACCALVLLRSRRSCSRPLSVTHFAREEALSSLVTAYIAWVSTGCMSYNKSLRLHSSAVLARLLLTTPKRARQEQKSAVATREDEEWKKLLLQCYKMKPLLATPVHLTSASMAGSAPASTSARSRSSTPSSSCRAPSLSDQA